MMRSGLYARTNIVIIFAIVTLFVSGTAGASPNSHDRDVLVALANSLPGLQEAPYSWPDSNSGSLSWDEGVTIRGGRVVEIEIVGWRMNNSSGWIHPSIKDLDELSTLAIRFCNLSRGIPEIGHLPLVNLTLSDNYLSGSAPNFYNETLQILDLSGNLLTQRIDQSPWELPKSLQYLDLGTNSFSTVPNFTGTLPALLELDLDHNLLSGAFPQGWSKPFEQNLIALFMDVNPFLQITPDLSSFSRLKDISIANCSISGPLPSWITQFNDLEILDLSLNYLEGPLPNFSNLTRLIYLDLEYNFLLGTLNNTNVIGSTADTTRVSGSACNLNCNNLTCNKQLYPNSTCCNRTNDTNCKPYPRPPISTTTSTSTTLSTTSTTRASSGPCSSNIGDYAAATCNNGAWQVVGAVNNNNTLNIPTTDNIVIQGGYIQANSSVLEIDRTIDKFNQPAIATTGDVALNGTLILNVGSLNGETLNVTVISAPNVTGQFSGVEVRTPDSSSSKSGCRKVYARPKYTSTNVLVEVSQTSSCSNRNTIIIIVVCSVAGLILLVVIVIVILYALRRRGKFSSVVGEGDVSKRRNLTQTAFQD